VELRVCNTFTGQITSLPRTGLKLGRDDSLRGLYRPALLTAGGGSRSFELLVLSRDLRTQTFSAQDGKWGAVRHVSGYLHHRWQSGKESATAPVVIGRTIYRLCHLKPTSEFDSDEVAILAMDADAARADSIDLRLSCFLSMSRPSVEELILGATAGGTKLRGPRGRRADIDVDAVAATAVEPAGFDQHGSDRRAAGHGRSRSVRRDPV